MAYRDYLSPEVVEPVIWEALLAWESQAAHLVPVDKGDLRDSISIATNKNRASHGASAFLAEEGGGEVQAPSSDYVGVGGSVKEYAMATEFGRADMPNYPAQPWARPALDWIRSKIGQITGKELKVQMAAYNIRHPYKVKEYLAK